MSQVTIICPDIPEYLRNGMSQPKAAAIFLEKALHESLDRQPLMSPGRLIRISIGDDLMDRLVGSDKETPVATQLGEYVNAVIAKLKVSTVAPVDAQRSVYQQAFYDGIAPEIAAGKIVVAEGATGIGKGRVLARIAKEQAEAGRGPVAIAAPSVAILKQLIEEWLKAGYSTGSVSCVLGRQQFVDTESLRAILEAESSEVAQAIGVDKVSVVLKWLDDGCPAVVGNANTQPIKKIVPTVSCLDADLLYLVPELEPFGHYYQLSDQTSLQDPGFLAYSDLRETARKDVDVLFCTHAMIAYDIMSQRQNKTRVLPEYRTLLVDEAHQFERNIANIHTHNVSISSLRSLLRSTQAGSKAARDLCIKLCSEVMSISSGMLAEEADKLYFPDNFSPSGEYGVSSTERQLFGAMIRLYEALSSMLKKSRKKDPRLDIARTALSKVATTAKGSSSGYPVLVNNTPVKKWPIITTGKRSVEKEFVHLWSQLKGAVLVSATLSVPSGHGKGGGGWGYIYSVLHIPPHRGAALAPVVPPWVTQTPVLHLPDVDAVDLCYPSKEMYRDAPDDLSVAKKVWHQAIAGEIVAKPAKSSVGGTLVLLVSYEDVEGIGGCLIKEIGTERVLLKTRTASIEKQKHEFVRMSREGLRPVWLAVGNAWTGLDLRDELVGDESPEQDTILTDLVIPRINFADNLSISNMLRQRKQRSAKYAEAAFTLRQGLGRLVRRPGVRDRHIWFLDNRINHRKARYDVFRNIIEVYGGGAFSLPAKHG